MLKIQDEYFKAVNLVSRKVIENFPFFDKYHILVRFRRKIHFFKVYGTKYKCDFVVIFMHFQNLNFLYFISLMILKTANSLVFIEISLY